MAAFQGNHVVLVHKLPEFIDEWILKKLPVGKHISAVEINLTDRSKAIIWTNTREEGQIVVDNLNGLLIEGKTLAACFLSPRNGYCLKKGSSDSLFRRDNYRRKLTGDWQAAIDMSSGFSSKTSSSTGSTKMVAVPAWGKGNFGKNYKRDNLFQTKTKPIEYPANAYDQDDEWDD